MHNLSHLLVLALGLVPAGLLVNLLIWNHDADLLRLAAGSAVIGLSLWVNARWSRWFGSRPARP